MRLNYPTLLAAGMGLSCFAQELPTRKTLTIDLAQTIAQQALATCRADGYKVTIRVVDADNMVKVVLRDDGAFPSSEAVTVLKASTVILTGKDSGPPANVPQGAPPPAAPPGTTYFPGGVAIKVGSQLVGALGISGAPGGDKDAACANAALAKLADRLK